jgi:hypothetical protein
MTHTLNAKIGDDLYADIQAIADADYPDPKRRGLGNVSEVVRIALKALRDDHPMFRDRHAKSTDPDWASKTP